MPILVGVFVPFFVFSALIVLVGLSQTHTATHGSSSTPSFWDFITGKVYLKQLLGLAQQAASAITSRFAQSQLRHLAKFFLAMGTITAGWFGVNAQFSEAVAETLERFHSHGDPKARAKAAGAAAAAAAAKKAAHHAEQVASGASGDLHKYRTKNDTRVQHNTHAVDVAIPRTIGGIRTKEGELTRDLGRLKDRTRSLEDGAVKTWDWIRSHPFAGATAAFAGAVAVALSRLGLGAFRCNSLKKLLNKRGCGLWSDLDSLMGLAFAALAFSDLEELLKVAEEIEQDVIKLAQDALNIP